MSGFRTAQGAKGELHFATDLDLSLSKALDATIDLSKMGFGLRGARYALVADDLIIKYFEVSSIVTVDCNLWTLSDMAYILSLSLSFLCSPHQIENSPGEVTVTSADAVLGKL